MAPKKKAAATAPASKAPVKRRDGKPTRAEKKVANKAANAKLLAEETAALRALMPPAMNKYVHPDDGRKPTVYTDELGQLICLRFAIDPAFNIMKLNEDPEMPSTLWFYKWLIDQPHFEKAYARARDIQADLQAAEMERWAMEPLLGKKTTTRTKTTDNGDEETVEVQEYDNIERARLRVQTRQWLLAKYRPKKYGVAPIQLETAGDDALTELIAQFRVRNGELNA